MTSTPQLERRLRGMSEGQLRSMLATLIPRGAVHAERVRALETLLASPLGQSLRDTMAHWIVEEIVPVGRLVPQAYLNWRPPVRDAMTYVVARLSPARLAPKLLEQLELPPRTSPERRLLRLIAKVPGLQKLGQVIARNQHLRPVLRHALVRLENGIRDVTPQAIRAIVDSELGERVQKYEVRIAARILSEASVSAVVRFSWWNPASGERERGVFKVLKPHIPEYFQEDMEYLQGLAQHFAERHHRYGFPAQLIPDTFRKVRRLLQHEVNFRREQKTLVQAAELYRDIPFVRVPRVIRPLCACRVTALTEERGIKVTSAAARLPEPRRRKLAEQLVEALVAVPLLAAEDNVVFHGDPHAGNLLYHGATGELVLLDWALRERLSREQRRHLALLFLMLTLRDRVGTANEVRALSQNRILPQSSRAQAVRQTVNEYLDELPALRIASAADAMRLLERAALRGVRFPRPLIMLSKALFTLDGILADVGGDASFTTLALVRDVAQHWIGHRQAFRSPLRAQDWFTLQGSALLYTSRLWLRCERSVLDRVLPASGRRLATAPQA
jgi:ubiquinone biosynthesis protein